MDKLLAPASFVLVGILIAVYGIRGIVKRRITAFRRGSMPKLLEGTEAVSEGIIMTTLGVGFAGLGAILVFIGVHA